MTDIVILDGARTAIGTFGGSLAGTPPIALATHTAKAAMERSGVEPGQIGNVVYGHVINTEPRDMYLSRAAAIDAGVSDQAPAMNVNRLCGSGAQAIVSVIQSLGPRRCGIRPRRRCREHVARALQPAGRPLGPEDGRHFGRRHDGGRAHLPVRHRPYGCDGGERRPPSTRSPATSRTPSRSRARSGAAAISEGRFESQIVPIEIKVKRDMVALDTDEHLKATTLEGLGMLKTAFKKDGTVTPGNARHQ